MPITYDTWGGSWGTSWGTSWTVTVNPRTEGGGARLHRPGPYYRDASPDKKKQKQQQSDAARINNNAAWAALGLEELME